MTDTGRRAAAAELLVERAALRMPMCGRSMLPSLAEPMVLQIGPAGGARIGDVLVFRRDGIHVAHRIVAIAADRFTTSGDAQPHVLESVAPADVVGRAIAVWSDATAAAVRIDGRRHRLRGWYYARFHRIRRTVRAVRNKLAYLVLRLRPSRRARTVPRLVEALTAARRNDAEALVRALNADAERLRAADANHRCGAVLGEAARRLAIVDRLPVPVAAALRRARLAGLASTSRMQPALDDLMTALRAAEVPFALLKGAARLASGAPETACHPSDDLDVLLRAGDIDRAAAALVRAGWYYAEDAATVRRLRHRHHHVAPLYPPDGVFPVELHHELAEPGSLTTPTDWPALERYLVPLAGAEPALQLDAVGTALHLAIHAIGLTRLRDVVLLAQLLTRMSEAERGALQRIVQNERRDGVRLTAAVQLAAHIAGIGWPSDVAAGAYLRWAMRREDLPEVLRKRCGVAEAFMAGPAMRRGCYGQLVPRWSRSGQIALIPPRVIALCVTNAAAAVYAARIPASDEPAIT